jgi:TfoX/Sxy family transcriptional regulator of competence genes
MAYDEGLAERIRAVLDDEPGVTEKKMFGGLAFLLGGSMFVGIVKDELMVRVGPDGHDEALKDPDARPMDFTGRAMVGYVFVSPRGTFEDADLGRWVALGRKVAAALPAMVPGVKRATRPRKASAAGRRG